MNITHAIHEEVTGDKLEAIFKRQSELMFKYHDIEKRSGLLQTEDCPVNLDDKRGQARIKDFAWRVTEEVGEALDAYRSRDGEHFHEELIDGLHFLTELSILAGITPKEIVQNLVDSIPTLPTDAAKDKDCLDSIYELAQIQIYLDGAITAFVESIGMMCNCLKINLGNRAIWLQIRKHFINVFPTSGPVIFLFWQQLIFHRKKWLMFTSKISGQ